jgi:hypothetical protein
MDTMNDADSRSVEKVRAWTSLLAVFLGDAVICLVVLIGIRSSGASAQTSVAILGAAFTAVATMTTAYFGIKGIANTAQKTIAGSSRSDGVVQTSVPAQAARTSPSMVPSVEEGATSAGGGHD